jgi:hypothetical protein
MQTATPAHLRQLKQEFIETQLVVIGGGLAGLCCAITAARCSVSVALVQDRPVLGGNASSEVRLWVLGATSHMGNNNRWAREGGVIDEILVENMWRNPEGNSIIFDSILLEFAVREPKIRLFLNTAIDDADCDENKGILSVSGFCSQNQTCYTFAAPLFCDASGDGIIGFLSGAAFRMGAEGKDEFQEGLAPPRPAFELLGHSLYFYTRDVGRRVRFVPPSFALSEIQQIPRFRELSVKQDGCRLWWLEYGGNRDTVHETEEIKWELWRVAYGVWNYFKNSGRFPEAETLTLEWMGSIPGKRESRRFEGDYILTQQDIIEQRQHADAVSFGGWAIDLHPADGVYSSQPGCTQWHSKGVYQIPYRTMYSRNVPNLFLAGRIISASHIAFGSTRVMATTAHNAQAVGVAAAFCLTENLFPRNLTEPNRVKQLQQKLLRLGQFIPGLRAHGHDDLAQQATVAASSTKVLLSCCGSGEMVPLSSPRGVLLPLAAGPVPRFGFSGHARTPTELTCQLWTSSRAGNTTPDEFLQSRTLRLPAGRHQRLEVAFDLVLHRHAHYFVLFAANPDIELETSTETHTGVLLVSQTINKSVAKSPIQDPPEGSGVDRFGFWIPERRPAAQMLAIEVSPPLSLFAPENVVNGIARPWCGANCWIPDSADPQPRLRLSWPTAQRISTVEITLDTDFDHPMESVLMGHPEHIMPACVRSFDLCDGSGALLASVRENHQTRRLIHFDSPIMIRELCLILRQWGPAAPAVFEVRCY